MLLEMELSTILVVQTQHVVSVDSREDSRTSKCQFLLPYDPKITSCQMFGNSQVTFDFETINKFA